MNVLIGGLCTDEGPGYYLRMTTTRTTAERNDLRIIRLDRRTRELAARAAMLATVRASRAMAARGVTR